ncbi:hypothetical protein OKW33_004836 [Paraburkholderia atlantica]|uniref:hypothetical protein n=1 Tax=Paraburkholderia atlantica TaxID=2654982 RepID=UPI000371B208|nr:hypothetical protein [Paraburkholderia atlantica]MPW05550.1 hypothetical protein [Paraburkholderia atlantica]
MKINSAMKKQLKVEKFDQLLEPSLKAIADLGFEQRDDCYLLRALLGLAKDARRATFYDCTAYECFVNSVHVEDYENKMPLAQAIQFAIQVLMGWNTSAPRPILIAIVSADELSVVVKFHVKRATEQWLNENIEGYDDPVMSIESTEDIPSVLAASLM